MVYCDAMACIKVQMNYTAQDDYNFTKNTAT